MNKETCQGCPIEECHVEVDGLCNRCDDVEDWLAEHDKEVYNKALDDVLQCVEWGGYILDIKMRIENLKK